MPLDPVGVLESILSYFSQTFTILNIHFSYIVGIVLLD